MNFKKPDWGFWIELDRMEAWKAVALSLDIEPDSVKFNSDCYSLTPEPPADIASLFHKRCRLLEANITNHFKIYSMIAFAGSLRAQIGLKQFVGWARYRIWEIPEPIKGLSEPVVPFTPQIISQLIASQPEDSLSDEEMVEFGDPAPTLDNSQIRPPIYAADAHFRRIDPPVLQSGQTVPVQRMRAQEFAILAEMTRMGLEPLNLPPNPKGKPGIKAKIRAALGREGMWAGTTVFDRAWERLSKNGQIAYEK
jgi:hypothetical protein